MHKQLSPREHVVQRPSIYFGTSLDPKYSTYRSKDGSLWYGLRSPALEKMIEEVLNNAADQKSRDPGVRAIHVEFDRATGRIEVRNDGNGIPVETTTSHDGRQMYVPELVMGNLRSGNNFDDDVQRRTTGGCNGVGVKLTNIYSSTFTVTSGYQHPDTGRRVLYQQTWTDRMETCGEASITKKARVRDLGTTVSFLPRYDLFEVRPDLPSLEAYFHTRVREMVATVNGHLPPQAKKLKVYFRGEEIKCDLHAYAKAFCGGGDVVSVQGGDRWCISVFEKLPKEVLDDPTVGWSNDFERCAKAVPYSMSFVNHIPTVDGGTHQSEVLKLFTARVAEKLSTKKNAVKTDFVRKSIGTVVSAIVENPEFNHQGKSKLSMKPKTMGSVPRLTKKVLDKVVGGAARFARNAMERQEMASMATGKKRKRFNPKYEPAQKRGRNNTLFLTEGDSAKTLVIAGRSFYKIKKSIGVYPLKGKVLNVRAASAKDIMKNQEVQDFIQIMGFGIDKKGRGIPPSRDRLAYQTITIMTDQDTDGSHIKGLILNLLGHFWPTTLEWPGFVRVFHTPIIRCYSSRDYHEFFTLERYKTWWDTVEDKSRWDVQYYKGLGTNTRKDAQTMFSEADKYIVPFDPVQASELDDIDMCFSNKRAEERKALLTVPSNNVSRPETVREFARGELLDHFRADNQRSIPSIVDGLKPSQRKVLFACLKRRLTKKMVVEKLAGYVGEHAAYHHGQKSLEETIVAMAADFVGGLNLPLLVPASMMGTRLEGGKDHASSRYTKTFLQPYMTRLFPASTNINLEYIEEEGERIEPTHYFPVVCLVLVNGCHGIGTGYSTHVPAHHLGDVVRRQRAYLREEDYRSIPIRPFVKGFTGTTEVVQQKVVHTGTYRWIVPNKEAHVTELPPGKWTTPYITMHRDKERKVVNNGNDERVDLVIKADHLSEADLQLVTKESLSNFVLFTPLGGLTKYASIDEIFDAYMRVGLVTYEKNVQAKRTALQQALLGLARKLKFIEVYRSLQGQPIVESEDGTFPTIAPRMAEAGHPAPYRDLIDGDGRVLVGLTDRALHRLEAKFQAVERDIVHWDNMTAVRMWEEDLRQFESALSAVVE